MLPIIYGIREAAVGYDELLLKCPSCEGHTLAEVMIFSRYYHFFFVPIFPFAKEAHIACTQCRLRRSGVPVDKDLILNYEEVKTKFRHPWYTYTGTGIGITIIIGILLAALT